MSMVILQMQFTKSQISSCPTPKQRCTIHWTKLTWGMIPTIHPDPKTMVSLTLEILGVKIVPILL